MKICVVGSRDFQDSELLDTVLSKIFSTNDILISGGAKGADTIAEEWAKDNGYHVKIYRPNWEKYQKSAGFRRNEVMVDKSDTVIAFWNGESRGTAHSIELAVATGKLNKIIRYNPIPKEKNIGKNKKSESNRRTVKLFTKRRSRSNSS